MKKLKGILATVALASLLVGCQEATPKESSKENDQISVKIVLSEDKGETIVKEVEVDVDKDTNAFEATDEAFDIKHDNGFITEIEGISQDQKENKYWMLEVNDEESMVGAKEVELKDGDVIEWDRHVVQ